jgi:ATP-binding cassette ChvD family protein
MSSVYGRKIPCYSLFSATRADFRRPKATAAIGFHAVRARAAFFGPLIKSLMAGNWPGLREASRSGAVFGGLARVLGYLWPPFRASRHEAHAARRKFHEPRDSSDMAGPQYTYVMKGLSKTYPGGRQVLKDIWLSFLPGAKIGIVGVNGSGKSTLLRLMAGTDKEFTGEAWAADGVRVGYLPQEPQLDAAFDVLGNVMAGVAGKKALVDRYNEIASNYTDETADEMSKLQDEIEAQGLWDLDSQVEMAMDALRCPEPDADVATLSGGEKRRVALCKLLLEAPDILLLDEPTNHLDAESVAWLEHTLREFKGTVVLVTHDRYFLDNVTGWILELDRGRGIPHEGNYTSFLDVQDKRLLQEGASEEARERTLSREREWIKTSPRARQAKSKARINAYEELLAKSQEMRSGPAQIVIPSGPRLGSIVVEATGLSKAYGERLLFENLDFNLPPGGIVGVIGPNGAGKTTLFRILTGQEKPDGGTLRVGDTVTIGYVDQSRDTLDANKTVWEEISGGADVLELGKRTMQSRAYVGAFNFKGGDQQKKVGQLSGGERNRVHLAKMLKSGANLLLLDEPTNDLDVETLRALEAALEDFAGCAMIISHDRWFLDRVATHMLAFEGESHAEWFEGNYQDYEADRKRRFGIDAETPHRIKYKRFARA